MCVNVDARVGTASVSERGGGQVRIPFGGCSACVSGEYVEWMPTGRDVVYSSRDRGRGSRS